MSSQESQRDKAEDSRLSRTLRSTNDKAIGTQDADFLSLYAAPRVVETLSRLQLTPSRLFCLVFRGH